MQEEQLEGTGAEAPFGSRLLAAVRREGLPIGTFDYAAIQELKRADREGTIGILRRELSTLPFATIQALRTEEPEDFVRRFAEERRAAAAQLTLVMLLAMT